MPPRKKRAKKSLPEDPDQPLDYVAHIRERSGRQFENVVRRKNVNYDVEQNVREIRALLKINAEIFDRCMSSASSYSDGKSARFARYGFDVVKVRQQNEKTQFITEHEHSEQTFDMKLLSELPAGIDNIFVPKNRDAPFDGFVDYDAFFQDAVMLHDDVLGPFLAKLKIHLESIQVCLGKIETWLNEPNSNIEFLETTFGKKLKMPTADDFNKECKKFHILKSCNESGTFVKTFEIAKKNDQTKLEKFLEFMAS